MVACECRLESVIRCLDDAGGLELVKRDVDMHTAAAGDEERVAPDQTRDELRLAVAQLSFDARPREPAVQRVLLSSARFRHQKWAHIGISAVRRNAQRVRQQAAALSRPTVLLLLPPAMRELAVVVVVGLAAERAGCETF